jgi:hypothetical protein
MQPEMKQSEKRRIADLSLWTGMFLFVALALELFVSGEIGWGIASLIGAVASAISIIIGQFKD